MDPLNSHTSPLLTCLCQETVLVTSITTLALGVFAFLEITCTRFSLPRPLKQLGPFTAGALTSIGGVGVTWYVLKRVESIAQRPWKERLPSMHPTHAWIYNPPDDYVEVKKLLDGKKSVSIFRVNQERGCLLAALLKQDGYQVTEFVRALTGNTSDRHLFLECGTHRSFLVQDSVIKEQTAIYAQ